MRTRAALLMALLGTLFRPFAGEATQPCEVVAMPCTFEGVPFKITVVDAETHQPLADVHALAEWQTYAGGRLDGALVAFDAVSAANGVLAFPGWGPMQGSVEGIGTGRDPVLTLFKTDYFPLTLYNRYVTSSREQERVRRFAQDGQTFALVRFNGTLDQWLAELKRVWLGLAAGPAGRLEASPEALRKPYANRLSRISAERSKFPLSGKPYASGNFPPQNLPYESFFQSVDLEMKSFR